MRMPPLQLDFLGRRRPLWAGLVLLATGLAFAGEVGLSYRHLHSDVTQMEARLVAAPAPSATSAGLRAPEAGEIAFARETVRRLSTPWEKLFAALEWAHSERVVLLSIEPDAEAGTVSIAGEARDYLAALTYVANLAEQGTLNRVHLARHELTRSGPRRVAFTVSASWREAR